MGLFKTDEEKSAAQAQKIAEWEAQYKTHQASSPVQLWEYRTELFGTGTKLEQIQRALNVLGSQGWELVSTDVERNDRIMGAPAQTTCVFKRPL